MGCRYIERIERRKHPHPLIFDYLNSYNRNYVCDSSSERLSRSDAAFAPAAMELPLLCSPDREVDCVNLSFDQFCLADPDMEETGRQPLSPSYLADIWDWGVEAWSHHVPVRSSRGP
jgi:hypothetical protein